MRSQRAAHGVMPVFFVHAAVDTNSAKGCQSNKMYFPAQQSVCNSFLDCVCTAKGETLGYLLSYIHCQLCLSAASTSPREGSSTAQNSDKSLEAQKDRRGTGHRLSRVF